MPENNVSMTGIEFTIKGSSDDASSSVKNLKDTLSELNGELDKSGKAALRFRNFTKALDMLGKVDLDKVKEALSDVAESLEEFADVAEYAKNVASFGNAMAKLAKDPQGLADSAVVLAQIATLDFSNVSDAAEGFQAMAKAASAIAKLKAIMPGGGNSNALKSYTSDDIWAKVANSSQYELDDPTHQWAKDMTDMVEFEDKGGLANVMSVLDIPGLDKAASAVKRLGTWLGSLRKDSTGLGEAITQLKKLAKIDFSNVEKANAGLSGLGKIASAFAKLSEHPEELKHLYRWLSDIATIDFTNIKEAGAGLRNIAAAANSLAKIPQATKETGDAAKKANSPLKTFLKSLGRIAFYRIIRGILKSITQAFQEGLKNAYMFDKIAGGGLADALDNLATKSLTMKNQLGAAFGGLLTAITPVVIQIIKIVTALASAITRLIAILGGNSQWLKAKDVWTEWEDAAEGAGGAAKEALKYLAPFDELNVLPSQRSGGGGGGGDNYGDMFEWVDTDVGSGFLDAITEAFSKLSDWFQSKDWQDIGGQAWQTLKDIFTDGTAANEAVTSFMEALGSAFGAIVGTAWGFIHDLVEDLAIQFKNNLIDYNGDGKLTATDFLKAVLKTGGDIATWVYDTLVKPFFDGFGRALTGDSSFDFTNWAKENFLNPIIRAWNTFTQEMLNPFIESINSAIDYINDQFNTNIPHIPLIGEVAELEVKVPNKDRKIPNGIMTVKEFKDAVPTTKKTIGGVTANATNVKDSISKDKKWFEYFGVSVSTLNDKIDEKAKQISGVKANIDAVETSPVKKGGLTLGGVSAEIVKVDTAKLTAEQKRVTTTANMKYVRTGDLTSDQRRLWTTANMKYVRTTDLKDEARRIRTTANMKYVRTNDLTDEARRIRTTANLNGVINSLTDSQKTISTIASFSSIKKNDGIVDAYGYIRVPTIAKIVGTEGYSMIDLKNSNSGNGFRFSASSPSYSMGNSENEEAMYRAMSRALADSELGGDIELDGEVLYKNVVTRNRANTRLTGVNALA